MTKQAKFQPCLRHVRSTPTKRHSSGDFRFRPDFVGCTPRCGLSGWWCRWSVGDPKRSTYIEIGVGLGLRLQDHVKWSFSGTTGASETTYLRDLTEPSEIISDACKPFLVRVLAS